TSSTRRGGPPGPPRLTSTSRSPYSRPQGTTVRTLRRARGTILSRNDQPPSMHPDIRMPLTRIPRPRPVWIEPEPIPDDFDILSLHPHRLIASLLYRRGIRTPEAAHAFL